MSCGKEDIDKEKRLTFSTLLVSCRLVHNHVTTLLEQGRQQKKKSLLDPIINLFRRQAKLYMWVSEWLRRREIRVTSSRQLLSVDDFCGIFLSWRLLHTPTHHWKRSPKQKEQDKEQLHLGATIALTCRHLCTCTQTHTVTFEIGSTRVTRVVCVC